MPRIKYVGTKDDGESAFSRETQITWFPGDSHDMTDAMAARMLQHPDVFAPDEATFELAIKLGDGTVKVLDGMDRAELHALAKDLSLGVHHNAGEKKVIDALLDAFPLDGSDPQPGELEVQPLLEDPTQVQSLSTSEVEVLATAEVAALTTEDVAVLDITQVQGLSLAPGVTLAT